MVLVGTVTLQRRNQTQVKRQYCIAAILTLGRCRPQNGSHASFYILISRRPPRYTDANGRATLPFCWTTPAGAIALYPFDHLSGASILAEGNQNLVQRHFVQNFAPALLQCFSETACKPTVPLDEVRNAESS
jgi:hypothetical protein